MDGSLEKKEWKRRAPSEAEIPTLHAALQAREDGKKAHLCAPRTSENYTGHVRRACEWLQHSLEGHVASDEVTALEVTSCHSIEDFYNDPLSKDAFEHIPNGRSSEVLSLYLGWKGFQEKVSQSTIEGIRAAFKWHWDST